MLPIAVQIHAVNCSQTQEPIITLQRFFTLKKRETERGTTHTKKKTVVLFPFPPSSSQVVYEFRGKSDE
ncbi:hypothetical protein BRADI_2g36985v3 [Brachypodium distachyon]|uniref:Uncharacterized protein n=1 Tax=Brachypodium distachyon TaxID=15368 RepID=A0A0Q3J4Q6_BRADI|nr:hypothetical protein BRADI_2g36985v3 [Brachypodium distachyon]